MDYVSHLELLLDPERNKWVGNKVATAIRKADWRFDTFVASGLSGTLILPQVARLLAKNMVVVRKRGEDRHSGLVVEGLNPTKRFVILDDFISSGDTVRRIISKIREQSHDRKYQDLPVCAGIALHRGADREDSTGFGEIPVLNLALFRKNSRKNISVEIPF